MEIINYIELPEKIEYNNNMKSYIEYPKQGTYRNFIIIMNILYKIYMYILSNKINKKRKRKRNKDNTKSKKKKIVQRKAKKRKFNEIS